LENVLAHIESGTDSLPDARSESIEIFEAGLAKFGLREALAYLNSWVDFRYTAMARLQGDLFLTVEVFDKFGKLSTEDFPDQPFNDSFCQFVKRDGPWAVPDTRLEPMLDGNKNQGVVISYVGVPVLNGIGGDFYGTLCHFDFEPRRVGDRHYEFLKQAGLVLSTIFEPSALAID